jgi:hypothetical protein
MASLNKQQFSPYIPPERVREVNAAMPPVFVGSSPNAEARDARTSPANPRGASGKLAVGRMRAKHALARDIMQSGVPVGHLQGIDSIRLGKHLSPGTRAMTHTYLGTMRNGSPPTPEVLAHKGHSVIDFASKYGPNVPLAQGDAVNPGNRASREERRRDLVHEIGHHNDPLSTDQFTSIGVNEATAENYADTYLGPTKTTVPSTYDDPANNALTRGQKASYAKVRVKH